MPGKGSDLPLHDNRTVDMVHFRTPEKILSLPDRERQFKWAGLRLVGSIAFAYPLLNKIATLFTVQSRLYIETSQR